MPFVSVTRLRIRKLWYLPEFFFRTWRSARQLREAPGFVEGALALGAGFTSWTVTVWESEAAMRAYRIGGGHMRAMPKLLDWCDEAAVAHWEQADTGQPAMEDAARRLGESGRISKVRNPLPAHVRNETWPDRRVPRVGRAVRPSGGKPAGKS